MRIRGVGIEAFVFALVVACSPVGEVAATTTTILATTTTAPQPVTTVAVPFGCEDEVDFIDTGRIARIDQPRSDSNTIGAITWDTRDVCEAFTIEFETTEGAPATTPPRVIADFLDSGQVVRLSLDVDATVLTDQLVETAVVDRLYVVRALNGTMFIDLHLAEPVEARVEVGHSPATMTIQLQPSLVAFTGTSSISRLAVVVTPTAGSAAIDS